MRVCGVIALLSYRAVADEHLFGVRLSVDAVE